MNGDNSGTGVGGLGREHENVLYGETPPIPFHIAFFTEKVTFSCTFDRKMAPLPHTYRRDTAFRFVIFSCITI